LQKVSKLKSEIQQQFNKETATQASEMAKQGEKDLTAATTLWEAVTCVIVMYLNSNYYTILRLTLQHIG
jgi:hypothetical protein